MAKQDKVTSNKQDVSKSQATTSQDTSSNLPPTLTDEQIKAMASSINFDGVKVSGKTRDKFKEVSDMVVSQFGDNPKVKEAMNLLFTTATDSGIVANGDARTTNKSDTPSMSSLRMAFAELCKTWCKDMEMPKLDDNAQPILDADGKEITTKCVGGYRVMKNSNREYYFIDADGNRRIPALYCKKVKETVATTDDEVTKADGETSE